MPPDTGTLLNPECLRLRQRLLERCKAMHRQVQFRYPEGVKMAKAVVAAGCIIKCSPILEAPHAYLASLLEAMRLEKAKTRWRNGDEFELTGIQTVIDLVGSLMGKTRSP